MKLRNDGKAYFHTYRNPSLPHPEPSILIHHRKKLRHERRERSLTSGTNDGLNRADLQKTETTLPRSLKNKLIIYVLREAWSIVQEILRDAQNDVKRGATRSPSSRTK